MESATNNVGMFYFFARVLSDRANTILFIKICRFHFLVVVIEIVENTMHIIKSFPLENHTPSTCQNYWLIISLQLPT